MSLKWDLAVRGVVDIEDAIQILERQGPTLTSEAELSELHMALAEAKTAEGHALSTKRFFKFMQAHGCQCCSLRMTIQDTARQNDWGEGTKLAVDAFRVLNIVIRVSARRAGGMLLNVGDVTKATVAYRKFADAIGALTESSGLREAKNFKDMREPGCPAINSGAENWREAVDDRGEPVSPDGKVNR